LRVASVDLPFVYAAWIKANECGEELTDRCASFLQASDGHLSFCVVLHAAGDHSIEQLRRSRRSVERQIYPHWTMTEWESGLNADFETDPDFIVPLRIGDQLSTTALFRFAEASRANRDASILYGDEDYLDERGRRYRPWFKPQWNSEMFLAMDYLSSSAAIDTCVAKNVCLANHPANISSLMLAATAACADRIVHIPHILSHTLANAGFDRRRLVEVSQHVEKVGARCKPGPFGTTKVEWPLPQNPPLVTIVVPTRDNLEVLKPCIEGVLEKTDYPNFEVLIIDNDSVEKSTAEFLTKIEKDRRVRVRAFHGGFNFSTMNNFAVRDARGTFVCLLNNDTEILEPVWLTEMMRYAVRPEVGAVGAKLLYDDGTIQHAGVIVGLGEAAGHAHRFLPANEPGYFAMPHVAQFVSAVTAACLLVEKAKLKSVNGLDPELACAFNDVDLCLKLKTAGWRNVYVPHAALLHHESKTRPKDQSPDQIERFMRELRILQDRWTTKTYADPQHNPNLDRLSETFVIDF
jgi:GT2 family glycosyltransferase